MILNAEQLKRAPILLDTEDLLDTIGDLQRQLAAYKALTHQTKDRTALDAYVQEQVDRRDDQWRLALGYIPNGAHKPPIAPR